MSHTREEREVILFRYKIGPLCNTRLHLTGPSTVSNSESQGTSIPCKTSGPSPRSLLV